MTRSSLEGLCCNGLPRRGVRAVEGARLEIAWVPKGASRVQIPPSPLSCHVLSYAGRGTPYLLLPVLTTSFTFAPSARWCPGPGFSEITWPFFTVLVWECETCPTRQLCALMARSAALRVLPLTFGTTHVASGETFAAKCA